MKQLQNGFFPLPNFHLLPAEYWHLYPKLFDPQNGFIRKAFGSRKVCFTAVVLLLFNLN